MLDYILAEDRNGIDADCYDCNANVSSRNHILRGRETPVDEGYTGEAVNSLLCSR